MRNNNLLTEYEKSLVESFEPLSYSEFFTRIRQIKDQDFTEEFVHQIQDMMRRKVATEYEDYSTPQLEPEGVTTFEESLQLKYQSLNENNKKLWNKGEFIW